MCKELIKTFTKEDFQNGFVNLHIHSSFSDGEIDFETLCYQAKKKQIKYFSITDHNTIEGHRKYKFDNLITGVEFDVWYKYIFLHLLAYGINPDSEFMEEFYAKDKRGKTTDIVRFFSRRKIDKLINAIHQAGGIAVLAHPACCWALSMENFVKDLIDIGLDGIEVYYPYPRWRKYIKFSNPDEISEIADKYNLIKTGGTDSHSSL